MADRSTAPLSALLSLVNEKVLNLKDPERIYVGLEDIPSRGTALLSHGWAEDSVSTNNVFKAGDILFGKLRPRLRKSIRIDRPGYCSTDILVLRPNADVDPEFAGYVAQSDAVFTQAIRTEEGTKMPRCSWQQIQSTPIYLPSSREMQKEIAGVLAHVDRAIDGCEDLIAKHKQIKAGLMHDLFTRGVLPNGQLRPPHRDAPELYQETKLGWIPAEWHFELLDKLALRGSGHTPNKDHPEYWNGGIKWVSLADSHRLDQLYISDTELKISYQGIQNSSAVLHPPGIVVLSRDAGVGKSAITTEPMAVSQHFMCWKCDQKMDNHFLYYWLQFNKRTFENIAMGSTILTIGLAYFKRLRIACPVQLEEQKLIASKLRAADEMLMSFQRDLEKTKRQKLGLMHDLLTGRVAVDHLVAVLADA
jgi:restriction endonuclease S subunit